MCGMAFAGVGPFKASEYANKADDILKRNASGEITSTTSTDTLGSSSDRWDKIWADDIDTTVATIGGLSSGSVTIDVTDAEAFLVRKAGDTGDVFTVDTVGSQVKYLSTGVFGAAATPTLSFGDGDTGFYESADDNLIISIGGASRYEFTNTIFQSTGSHWGLNRVTPTNTAPTLLPAKGDSDTGIGENVGDQLSLIAGAKEMLRLSETGTATTDQIIIAPAGIIGTTTTPALAFGDGDSGFYESADDEFNLSIGGTALFQAQTNGIIFTTGSFRPQIRNVNPTATSPAYAFSADTNTGIGRATADQLSLIAGGVEGIRITEATNITTQLVDSVGFDAIDTITYNGTTTTADWGTTNVATMTFGAGNIGTFAFTDPTVVGQAVKLKLIQDGTGSRVVTAWDADIQWSGGGAAPTLSTGSAAEDWVTCIFTNTGAGNRYDCSASLDFQ